MSCELVPQEVVWQSVADALAIAHEFDGAPLADKLAAFGLDAAVVRDIVMERWEAAQALGAADATAFAIGFAEGIVSGVLVAART